MPTLLLTNFNRRKLVGDEYKKPPSLSVPISPSINVADNTIEHGACISAVNAAEVHGKLCDSGMPAEMAEELIQGLGIDIVDFDAKQASLTGSLRAVTKNSGLSLSDRACLALALKLESAALTADRAWKELEVQVDVRVIR